MKELFPVIEDWVKKDKVFTLATVIQTWGSSPRPVGSAMIVSSETDMAGSVSGGCVEGAVVRAAKPLQSSGGAQRLAYGVADEDAWAVGLSCGGKIQVFAERFLAFDPRPEEQTVWKHLKERLGGNQSCVLLTRITDGQTAHSIFLPDSETFAGHAVAPELRQEVIRAYRERKSQVLTAGETSYFAQVFPRRSQMLIIGAAHITADLVRFARDFDFETTVIDPRGFFANKTHFPVPPDALHEKYPAEVLPDFTLDPYTYAVILSHDPKIDDNALHILLRSDVGYIGALGSRKTHAKRTARLEKAGYTPEEIARIHAPIGMDINAQTPREIALAVMGEIIKVKNAYL